MRLVELVGAAVVVMISCLVDASDWGLGGGSGRGAEGAIAADNSGTG